MASSASSERTIGKKTARQKADEVSNRRVIEAMMANTETRRWLWLLLADCHIFHQSLNVGPGGSAITAFNEGRRSIGLKIMTDILNYCPDKYVTMTRENSGVTFGETGNEIEPSDAEE